MNLQRAHYMLKLVRDEIKKDYYDPSYHGVDLDETFRQYDQRLDASQGVNDTFRVIAAFVMQLHDTHTFFIPPSRQNFSTMGYSMAMIGDKCIVTHIRPNVDAAKKLHVGDQVLAINGFNIRRSEFSNMQYFFHLLSPAPTEVLDLQSPAGERRKETIQALLIPGKPLLDLTDDSSGDFNKMVRQMEGDALQDRQRYHEDGAVFIWKMPSFEASAHDVDTMFGKVGSHQTLILDLRDNPGGSIDILKLMLSHIFDHEVKIADEVSRKQTKPMLVKGKPTAFPGKLIILVNDQSASCSELFAKVVQLEKRGIIVGDQSAGAVMESVPHDEQLGSDSVIPFEVSITYANLLMTDGKSLEAAGVTPDELLLPTPQDLADGKDPVLSHALELAGVTLDPTAAGKLFPFEWPDL